MGVLLIVGIAVSETFKIIFIFLKVKNIINLKWKDAFCLKISLGLKQQVDYLLNIANEATDIRVILLEDGTFSYERSFILT